jgi:serine/threonine-protein kinase
MDESAGPDPLIGRTVADGRYEVLARLGTGGMGTVYRVRQHPLERMAVLKLIHREMATDASAVARFEREMRVTAAIEHPHTVRVYDFGQIEGQPFLAMEYLAGRSLRQELDRSGALPAERVASIGVQIAKALGAAHRVGVVHRDLKPDNVMLVEGYGERDFVKVLDFGIARSLDQGEAGFRTKAGAIIGTPAYMSPEQASTVPLDARSDLYSLGVVLYEMLAGTPPFVGESITALLFAHVSVAPPPLPSRISRPPALEAAILRLLSKDPAMRPASADETVDLLSPFVAGPTTGTRAAPRPDDIATSPGAASPSAPRPSSTEALPTGGGGTMVLPPSSGGAPVEPEMPHTVPSRPAVANRRSPWPRIAGGLVLVGLIAAGFVYRRATHVEVADPAAMAKIAPFLQADNEPPWPLKCGALSASQARDLASAAAFLGSGASEEDRARGLVALLGHNDGLAQRWMIEARGMLSTDPEVALSAAAYAVEHCPQSAAAHNLLGNALQKTQRLDRAEQEYRRAIELEPQRPLPPYLAPRFNLGLLAIRRGDATAALAAFDEIARAQPTYPNVFLVRAEAHRRAGDVAAATADLRQQVVYSPSNADGWYQLGRALGAQDPKGSNEAFCRAKALGHAQAAAQCRE